MGLQERDASLKTFAQVISDGSIRVKVDENTPGAVKREYETPDGKTGIKWEKVYQSLSGVINSLEFKDTDYGQFMNLEVDGIVLSLNTEGSFAQDLMKKLPSVNLDEEIKITPYSFTGESGKNLKGVTIMQGGLKIKSHFWDEENKKVLNGLPTVSKEASQNYQKYDWKIFFIGIKKFLINYNLTNVVPKIKPREQQFQENLDKAGIAAPPLPEDYGDEIKVDNIPF
jgi:hypothetical protein